jgi:major vault protein
MGRYDEYENDGRAVAPRQRDFVLNMNEFAHILSKTDGNIKCAVGPFQTSLSQQETPVIFNTVNKRFEECGDYDKAKQLFISAPEGWYVVLKNPTADGQHPQAGRPNQSPSNLEIGKKVNIFGPESFALYPGQMAKVIQGHRLRSNQYLLARVYDADAANKNEGVVTDTDGKEQKTSNKFFPGQMLVIEGTKVSFYIPPTGIEVIPVDEKNYIRDAVTLERLEYCILKDENGNKRYLHGPDVVFPKPTETFVKTSHGGYCFRAIELSKISGIYVKVIAEYTENGVTHPIGEELFITGNEQMIYYPRPEHAIISYDGKHMHHAIAIPEGEGRYVMNRETGEIKTVVGPKMYLPDPRKEVVVKRKLTSKECQLWYPGNVDAIEYNKSLNEKSLEKNIKKLGGVSDIKNFVFNSAFSDVASMDCLESNAGISRGTSYTKPRTITIDNRFDGVITIDVWTGYAINVTSKSGTREVVVGPKTKLLNYDETLEVLELSTGRPKTTDNLIKTVFLRVENNKISDLINVQTKDFVNVQIKVSYCVDFLEKYKDKWFSVENYVKYMCDRQRSLLKREAKRYNIEDFYTNASDIVRKVCLALPNENEERGESEVGREGRFFKENGMLVHDVEVLSIAVESNVASILNEHQEEMIRKCLELSDATRKMEVVTKLAAFEKEEAKIRYDNQIHKLELKKTLEMEELKAKEELDKKEREQLEAKKQAECDMQTLIDAITEAKLERTKKEDATQLEYEKAKANIEKAKQEAYAETVSKIVTAIGPDLVAALTSTSNASMLETVTKSMAPYAIARGNESVAEVTDRLLRGTNLEKLIENLGKVKE